MGAGLKTSPPVCFPTLSVHVSPTPWWNKWNYATDRAR